MVTAMPSDRSRSRIIREHLKKQKQDAEGRSLPRAKLSVKGKTDYVSVYRLNTELLAFNKANGRIKAEVLEKEVELGRKLDDSDPDDQSTIRDILLSIRRDENDKVLEDLSKNGQMQPGIITCDGIVINGNRRKALLEELYRDTRDEKYKYLEVQVLPSEITKAELWLIEAGIQLSTPQQLDYSPINHLLKLREGIDSGLEIEAMAARIYGVTEERLKSDLDRLRLIDEYLCEFVSKPNKYHLVRGLNEHFIDLQDILDWAKTPRGRVRRDWVADENDINELKLVGFHYIRIKFAHLRIRALRDIFATRKSWDVLRDVVSKPLGGRQEIDDADSGESAERAEEESDDSTESEATTALEEQDIREETLWGKNHEAELKIYYADAKEQEQIVKDSEKPLALARRALKNLRAIPSTPEKLVEPEMDGVLGEVISVTNDLRKILHKTRQCSSQSKTARKRKPSKRSRR